VKEGGKEGDVTYLNVFTNVIMYINVFICRNEARSCV